MLGTNALVRELGRSFPVRCSQVCRISLSAHKICARYTSPQYRPHYITERVHCSVCEGWINVFDQVRYGNARQAASSECHKEIDSAAAASLWCLNYAECIFLANLPRIDPSFHGFDGTQTSSTDVLLCFEAMRCNTVFHVVCQMFTPNDYPSSKYLNLLRVTRDVSICWEMAASWRV